MSSPICIGEGSGEAEGLQAEGHIRIPLGDGTDAVWRLRPAQATRTTETSFI